MAGSSAGTSWDEGPTVKLLAPFPTPGSNRHIWAAAGRPISQSLGLLLGAAGRLHLSQRLAWAVGLLTRTLSLPEGTWLLPLLIELRIWLHSAKGSGVSLPETLDRELPGSEAATHDADLDCQLHGNLKSPWKPISGYTRAKSSRLGQFRWEDALYMWVGPSHELESRTSH